MSWFRADILYYLTGKEARKGARGDRFKLILKTVSPPIVQVEF